MQWLKHFVPDMVIKNYLELTAEDLHSRQVSHLLLDIDNTLVPHDEPLADDIVLRWLQAMKLQGITIILISNNNAKRVSRFAKLVELPYYASALKPLPFTYQRIIQEYQLDKRKVMAMGDQIMTDVWGAHNAGLPVIWSQPLVSRDLHYTKFNRLFERMIIKSLMKRGWLANGNSTV